MKRKIKFLSIFLAFVILFTDLTPQIVFAQNLDNFYSKTIKKNYQYSGHNVSKKNNSCLSVLNNFINPNNYKNLKCIKCNEKLINRDKADFNNQVNLSSIDGKKLYNMNNLVDVNTTTSFENHLVIPNTVYSEYDEYNKSYFIIQIGLNDFDPDLIDLYSLKFYVDNQVEPLETELSDYYDGEYPVFANYNNNITEGIHHIKAELYNPVYEKISFAETDISFVKSDQVENDECYFPVKDNDKALLICTVKGEQPEEVYLCDEENNIYSAASICFDAIWGYADIVESGLSDDYFDYIPDILGMNRYTYIMELAKPLKAGDYHYVLKYSDNSKFVSKNLVHVTEKASISANSTYIYQNTDDYLRINVTGANIKDNIRVTLSCNGVNLPTVITNVIHADNELESYDIFLKKIGWTNEYNEQIIDFNYSDVNDSSNLITNNTCSLKLNSFSESCNINYLKNEIVIPSNSSILGEEGSTLIADVDFESQLSFEQSFKLAGKVERNKVVFKLPYSIFDSINFYSVLNTLEFTGKNGKTYCYSLDMDYYSGKEVEEDDEDVSDNSADSQTLIITNEKTKRYGNSKNGYLELYNDKLCYSDGSINAEVYQGQEDNLRIEVTDLNGNVCLVNSFEALSKEKILGRNYYYYSFNINPQNLLAGEYNIIAYCGTDKAISSFQLIDKNSDLALYYYPYNDSDFENSSVQLDVYGAFDENDEITVNMIDINGNLVKENLKATLVSNINHNLTYTINNIDSSTLSDYGYYFQMKVNGKDVLDINGANYFDNDDNKIECFCNINYPWSLCTSEGNLNSLDCFVNLLEPSHPLELSLYDSISGEFYKNIDINETNSSKISREFIAFNQKLIDEIDSNELFLAEIKENGHFRAYIKESTFTPYQENDVINHDLLVKQKFYVEGFLSDIYNLDRGDEFSDIRMVSDSKCVKIKDDCIIGKKNGTANVKIYIENSDQSVFVTELKINVLKLNYKKKYKFTNIDETIDLNDLISVIPEKQTVYWDFIRENTVSANSINYYGSNFAKSNKAVGYIYNEFCEPYKIKIKFNSKVPHLNIGKIYVSNEKYIKVKLLNAPKNKVEWKSSDEEIATVSKGKIKIEDGFGTCVITATYEGKDYHLYVYNN